MELYKLYATLVLNDSDFTTKMAKVASNVDSFASKSTMATAKAVALGTALYNAGVSASRFAINLGKDAVEAAAEVQAEEARFSSIFGDLEESATSALKAIGEDNNIVYTRLRNIANQSFSQFTGAGLEAAEAMEKMDEYIRLAADAAAFYDVTLEDADYRIRSFLRGNVEAGDAIGLFTSQAQRNERALEKYNKKWAELNEEQRQLLLLDIASEIYNQTGVIGQAARESDMWTNALANLQEKMRLIKASVGGPILDALIPAMEKLTTWIEENPDTIEKIAGSIGDIAALSIDALVTGFEWLAENGDGIALKFSDILSTVKSLIDRSGTYSFDITETKRTVRESTGGFWRDMSDIIMDAFTTNPDDPWLPNAKGLPYVPYNDYYVSLHKGEAVLTAQQAEQWRGGGASDNTAAALDRLYTLLDGNATAVINIDGKRVGEMVAPTVSRYQGKQIANELRSIGNRL